MKATMKELGYDEDAEGEEGEEGEEGYEDPSDEEAAAAAARPPPPAAPAPARAEHKRRPRRPRRRRSLGAGAGVGAAPALAERPALHSAGASTSWEEANKNKRTQNLVMAAAIVCVIGGVATGIAIFLGSGPIGACV